LGEFLRVRDEINQPGDCQPWPRSCAAAPLGRAIFGMSFNAGEAIPQLRTQRLGALATSRNSEIREFASSIPDLRPCPPVNEPGGAAQISYRHASEGCPRSFMGRSDTQVAGRALSILSLVVGRQQTIEPSAQLRFGVGGEDLSKQPARIKPPDALHPSGIGCLSVGKNLGRYSCALAQGQPFPEDGTAIDGSPPKASNLEAIEPVQGLGINLDSLPRPI